METLNSNWDTGRVERLESLYRDGLSFSLIAADIGVTRNAAIGKAHRLKLPKRVEIISKPPRPASARRRRERRRSAAQAARVELPEPVIETIPGRDYRCSINDLADCSCRYPLWAPNTVHPDRRYCGIPAASVSKGQPYCWRHTMLCDGPNARK